MIAARSSLLGEKKTSCHECGDEAPAEDALGKAGSDGVMVVSVAARENKGLSYVGLCADLRGRHARFFLTRRGLRRTQQKGSGVDGLENALLAWSQADPRNRALLEAVVDAIGRVLREGALAPVDHAARTSTPEALSTSDVVTGAAAVAAPMESVGAGSATTGAPTSASLPEFERAAAPAHVPHVPPMDVAEAVRRLREGLETSLERSVPVQAQWERDAADGSEPAMDWASMRERLAVKAKCCEFVARRAEDRDANVSMYNYRKAEYEAIISRASQSRAALWMLPAPTTPVDVEQMRVWAEVFRNASLAAGIADGAPITRDLLALVAHAQSAVRAIADDADLDQAAMYHWLREQTRRESIYLGEHMADDRRADPADWAELRRQLTEFEAGQRKRRDEHRLRRNALTKIRHHVKRIRGDADAGREVDASDWRGVERGLQDLLECDPRGNDEDLSEALLPIGDLVDGAPEAIRAAVENATREEDEPQEVLRSWERSPTKELLKVRAFLRGKELVLIGGIRKAQAEEAIADAFELAAVRWIAIGPHKSLDHFRADVARPEVALVINLIRFSSHSYDEIAKDCRTAGKPYVRLTAGYSPNQIAAQVWEQLSEQIDGGT